MTKADAVTVAQFSPLDSKTDSLFEIFDRGMSETDAR
jgi:hypothetical protein